MDLQRRVKRSLSSVRWGRRASLLSVGSQGAPLNSPGSCAAAPEKETLPISAPHPAQLPPVRSSSHVSHLHQCLLINHRCALQLTAFLLHPTGISVLVVPLIPLTLLLSARGRAQAPIQSALLSFYLATW